VFEHLTEVEALGKKELAGDHTEALRVKFMAFLTDRQCSTDWFADGKGHNWAEYLVEVLQAMAAWEHVLTLEIAGLTEAQKTSIQVWVNKVYQPIKEVRNCSVLVTVLSLIGS
jgi:hypothetical protein